MKRFSLAFGFVLVTGLTVVSGIIFGRMSHRWGPTHDVLSAARKLEAMPTQFGNWQMRSSQEMSPNAVRMLECVGYFVREYVNTKTGETVNVAMVYGPSGPIAAHTPEICYNSRDYAIRDERQKVAIRGSAGTEDQFWALTFRSGDVSADTLRVYYAWSTGGRWLAPASNRFAFVGTPHLYKIQLAGHLPPQAATEMNDPCSAFLEEFLPTWQSLLAAVPNH